MVKSLFKLRNGSCFLINLRSATSMGNSKDCSTVLATYPALSYSKSLIEALLGRGASSSTKGGAQAGILACWSPLLSVIAPSLEDLVCMTLACLPPLWASTSLDGRFLLSSITSFPFWSHFLFLSAGLIQERSPKRGTPTCLGGSSLACVVTP